MDGLLKRVENIEFVLGNNSNHANLSERIDNIFKSIEAAINKISTFDNFYNKCKNFKMLIATLFIQIVTKYQK